MKIKSLLLLVLFICLQYCPADNLVNLLPKNDLKNIDGNFGKYNIIINPSFEIWLDSFGIQMPLGWYTSEAQDSGSAVRTTDAHSGIYALKLNGSDTSAYATTASLCQNNHNYYFSAWCKTTSWLAGSFIITWFKITQQPAGNPIIIPIIRSTSYYHYTQMLQSPDSAILVNINIVTLPFTTINVDDVTLSDTVLSGIEDGSNNSKELSRLKFYPNPCRTNIEINYDEEIEHLALYDISGQLILKISHPSPPRLKLDVSKYPNGIYFIQQQANKKVAILKFIKQN